eukprot:TRINITY_DN36822_c0_g1_i1.p1 TRINITY_DN36822_c0_g1~~TRINITY_DN36822_c0_g1_i1.p1  ORF type:complete len:371 (+),score=66.21 TRINITY_DN36822_c0_g1_i1:167-1114(+)
MAMIHFFAYSKSAAGVGVVAGAPYGCNIVYSQDQSACGDIKNPGAWTKFLPEVNSYTRDKAAKGLIDPVDHVKGKPAYIFSGTQDGVVKQVVMKAVGSQLEDFGAKVTSEFSIGSGHSWVVDNFVCWWPSWWPQWAKWCGSAMTSNHNYDTAGNMFRAVLPDRTLKQRQKVDSARNLFLVPQSKYAPAGTPAASFGLDETALMYIPDGCQNEASNCALHVHYHGCACSKSFMGLMQPRHMGIAEWAEPNGIMVLYPQMVSWANDSSGCWDWDYETGASFDSHNGLQLHTVIEMIRDVPALVAGRTPAKKTTVFRS